MENDECMVPADPRKLLGGLAEEDKFCVAKLRISVAKFRVDTRGRIFEAILKVSRGYLECVRSVSGGCL